MTGQVSAATTSEAPQATDMGNRNTDMNDPAYLRAKVEAAMFHHSQINPNGFSPLISREKRRARRAEIHDEIDRLLDEWATSRLLLALEHISQDPN